MAGGEELVKKLEPSSRSASSKRATSEFPCAAPSVPVDSTSAAPPTEAQRRQYWFPSPSSYFAKWTQPKDS